MSNDIGPYTQDLEQMLKKRWNPQSGQHGKHAVLYGIALDLLTECSALRTTEHNLRAELEKVRKDAERYRFIRDANRSSCIDDEITMYAEESLDECVDAAMEDEARIVGDEAMKGKE